MTVQRLRQSYNNELVPSEDKEAYYMFVKEHEGVVALLREQLELKDKMIQVTNEQNERLHRVISGMLDELRNR